jgi:hypothetical protein
MLNKLLINKICDHIGNRILSGEIDNDGMIQIIELVGSYLNLKTISDYSRENNISYNGAKKFRKNINLFGVKFVVDNY